MPSPAKIAGPFTPGRLLPRRQGTSGFTPFVISSCLITLTYAWVWVELLSFSRQNDLYSHLPLVPAISLGLVWLRRSELPPRSLADRPAAIFLFSLAIVLVGTPPLVASLGRDLAAPDRLACLTMSWVALTTTSAAVLLGRSLLRALAFPLAFLCFTAPLPEFLERSLEALLQEGSGAVAWIAFTVAGTPVLYHDLLFQLPGIRLEVAPQCSGIHSTFALFMTALVVGHLLLMLRRHRLLLALAVIPLGLLRNGARIFLIGELCVRVDPEMVHSPLHQQGGPLFFVLSLAPLGLLTWLLVRREQKSLRAAVHAHAAP